MVLNEKKNTPKFDDDENSDKGFIFEVDVEYSKRAT